MLLAMKIKVAITAASLASPIAPTMTPAPPADNIAETNSAEIAANQFPLRSASPIPIAAQGAHRTYMIDCIRDPRTGGCAAGAPPTNLGFRIVVEDENGLPCSAW